MRVGDDSAVLFFDVDGTLVGSKMRVDGAESHEEPVPTPAVYEAFRRLTTNGHLPFICTGRPYSIVPQELRDLDCAGMVTSAGASIIMDDKVAFEETIPLDILETLVRRLLDAQAEVHIEGTNNSYALASRGGEHFFLPDAVCVSSWEELCTVSDMRFCKVSFDNAEFARLDDSDGFVKRTFEFCDLNNGVSEISMRGVNKGSGIRRVLEMLGRENNANTFGFGDSENDLTMLAAVETPVAMGNAMESVKQASRYVTLSVDDDGVPAALEHFGLI